MSVKDHFVDNATNLWHQVTEGWQQLRDRAGRSVTRFIAAADAENTAPVVSWGLLPLDIKESADSIAVMLEAPGLDKKDIVIEVHDDALLVKGEKRYQRERQEGRYRIQECTYGSFQRLVPLPVPVDAEHADASYERGVLTVTLKKIPERGRRKIAVN